MSNLSGQFKHLFEAQREELLRQAGLLNPDYVLEEGSALDEADFATQELERSLRMRLHRRDEGLLNLIDDALSRIRGGTFGLCEDCGDAIELKRLQARPTASLCICCKEAQERREHEFAQRRESRSA